MINFLAFCFGRRFYKLTSPFIKLILQLRGVKVGKGFYIEGIPYLKIRGKASNIKIGNHVEIYGPIDLRNRENGKIVIHDHVRLENDVRLVAANDAILTLEEKCFLGPHNIINCGVDVTIGTYTISGPSVIIQSSNHGMDKGTPIWEQNHTYGVVNIGKDVWLGAGAKILAGVTIKDGGVVGAGAVVTKNVKPNEIVGGIPAKHIGERPDP
jgi:acetyltransferase-like isoleucine patch superfamily enzyme